MARSRKHTPYHVDVVRRMRDFWKFISATLLCADEMNGSVGPVD